MSRRYRASSARCSCSCCCSRVRHGARIRKGRARRIAADQASSNLRRRITSPPILHPIGAASLRDDRRALKSIQENVMPERLVSRAATAVSLIAASLALGATGARADCLPGPGQAAANGHWYYRIDHATNRKCWYLSQSGPAAAPEADGARAPQIGNRLPMPPPANRLRIPPPANRRTNMSQAALPKRSDRRCSTSSCCGRNGRSLDRTAPQELRRREMER